MLAVVCFEDAGLESKKSMCTCAMVDLLVDLLEVQLAYA